MADVRLLTLLLLVAVGTKRAVVGAIGASGTEDDDMGPTHANAASDGFSMAKCDDVEYARLHYVRCCTKGRQYLTKGRPSICEAAEPIIEDDDRTESYPKLVIPVRAPCVACARLVANFDMGLLPGLRKRQSQLEKHHSRTKYQKLATVGELEAIVEAEVERICSWPRTYHNKKVRRSCDALVEEHSDALVNAISRWAREGKYALHLGEDLSAEVRPALCADELELCSARELEQLDESDEEAAQQLANASKAGHEADKPLRSEVPSTAEDGVLQRVVSEDFHKRVIERGADADFLLYLYFPGRTTETRDTHALMRAKFIRLAEFLNAPGANGSLAVGWMDCVFNDIPYPHGAHVHKDTMALYPGGSKGNPRYWKDLREGELEITELVNFVFEASSNAGTRRHIQSRVSALGERAYYEGLEKKLLTFDESFLDERTVKALNVSQLREAVEKDEL